MGILAFLVLLMAFIYIALGGLRVFLPQLPALTGLPFGSKKYLVVFQNNNELRPAGGFISAFATASFTAGLLTDLKVEDVYWTVDQHPFMEPPYPMKKLLANEWYSGYTFRDANYDEDFPATAQELLRMIHITRPDYKVDGVIAVNYSVIEDLLGAVGPINIDGKDYSKETLFENLEYEVNNIDRHNLEDIKNRKSILKPLASALIKRVLFNPFKLGSACKAIVNSLNKKDIQLYFTDPGLQNLALDNRWAGAWPKDYSGDFLAVVEANLGGMKSDRYIKRNVTYHVKVNEGPQTGGLKASADVIIDVYHYGIENIPLSGDYTGFFRTYIPEGSKNIHVSDNYKADLWQQDANGYHVLGDIVRLKPGEKTQIEYSYDLPQSVLQKDNYQLYVPSQSGAADDDFSVIFEVPQGMRVSGNGMDLKENFAVFEGPLNKDHEFDLTVLPDKNPPNVIYQTVDNLTTISIIFNEKLTVSTAEDPLNYEITDLNAKDPETTDQITIDHIEDTGKGVRIFVKGMTNQPEEQYRVTMQNISDAAGNVIDPNPKTITVVQRFQ